MTILQGFMLLLEIFSRAGGPEQLKKWFTKNKEELLAMQAALRPPGHSKGH